MGMGMGMGGGEAIRDRPEAIHAGVPRPQALGVDSDFALQPSR